MRMRSLLVGLAVLAILIVVVGWFDRPDSTAGTVDGPGAEPELEQLAVTVDNERTRASEGDVLTYTTQVRNDESRTHRLRVTQMMPAALDVTSTSGTSREEAGEVVWDVALAPGEQRQFRVVAEVGATRNGYSQLTTTSCVGLRGGELSSCAADRDLLNASTMTTGPSAGRMLLAGGIVLLLGLAVVAVIVIGQGAPARPAARPGTQRPGERQGAQADDPAPADDLPDTADIPDTEDVPGNVLRPVVGTREREPVADGSDSDSGANRTGADGAGGVRVPTQRTSEDRDGRGAVPTRIADPVRSWIARVHGLLPSRSPAPTPSRHVRASPGKARGPPETPMSPYRS